MSAEQFNKLRQELEACPPRSYLRPSDLLMLPRQVEIALTRAFRAGKISLAEMAEGLGLELAEAQIISDILFQKGFLHKSEQEGSVYTARFGRMKTRPAESPLDKL